MRSQTYVLLVCAYFLAKCAEIGQALPMSNLTGKSYEVNVPCSSEDDCRVYPGSICNKTDNICRPSHQIHAIQVTDIPIGDPCAAGSTCVDSANSFCDEQMTNPVCKCKLGYDNIADPNKCALTMNTPIGGPCADDTQCVGSPNSQCDKTTDPANPVCKCIHGYFPGHDQRSCVLQSLIDEDCFTDIQCADYPNSQCVGNPSGTCKCIFGYYASDDQKKCIAKSFLNETCADAKDCLWISQASCIGERCQCLNGYVGEPGINDTCFALVDNLEGSCKESYVQCYSIPNSFCTTAKICMCKADFKAFNQICYDMSKRVGDICQSDNECSIPMGDGAECNAISKTCSCRTGFVPDFGGLICAGCLKLQMSQFLVILVVPFIHFLNSFCKT